MEAMNATKQPTGSSRLARIPYDSLTLCAVTAELNRHLTGGQIQDVRQPTPADITLAIRNHNRNYLLLLSADAQFARVHLTRTRRPNPPTPPNFCMTLRKHIEDRWIIGISQGGFDRILEIQVAGRDADDEPVTVRLIAELMGKHSNLILVNGAGTILDAAKRISHRINRVRETLPGLAYQPPPEQPDRADPFAPHAVEQIVRELPSLTTSQELTSALGQIFAGMSPFLAQEIAARAWETPDRAGNLRTVWTDIFDAARAGRFDPTLVRDASGKMLGAYPFPLRHLPTAHQQPADELNLALDDAFTALVDRGRYEAIQGELRGKIEREIKRLERQQAAARRALEEAARAEEYKQAGELILANLWRMQPGETAVTVQDYYDPELKDRMLTLNPKLTAQENADAYFQRYRKARDGQEKERARIAAAEAQLLELMAAQEELERFSTVESVQSLREELIAKRLLRPGEESGETDHKAEPEFAGHKIRRFPTPEGFDILVGETATANDYLTTRVAAPNDLWLHVRAAASAHVVIRTHGRPDAVPRSVLERAAILCARHSAQKHSSLVSVDYTLKKWVRKPRGSVPGAADYQKEITIDVTP
jgi:predicted ribosome quality control (RQC) complex YloA/Tae2 family protein